MNQLIRKLWNDEGGFILSTEAMMLWTITVLGIVVGLVAIRDATVVELTEVANTIVTFDQSYGYAGLTLVGGTQDAAIVSGSNAQDQAGTQAYTKSSTPTFYGVAAVNASELPNVTAQINVVHIAAP